MAHGIWNGMGRNVVVFDYSLSGSMSGSLTKSYNVIGNGIVICFITFRQSSVDAGTVHVELKHNGEIIANEGTRTTETQSGSSGTNQGVNVCFPIDAADGDTISVDYYYGVNANKILQIRCLCMGCMVVEVT